MRVVDIKRNIGQLSVNDRADLTRWIIINLDEVAEGDNTVDVAWRREVRTRVNEIKSGKVKMIPSEKMWKDILSGKERS
ncbi:MAG: addiction module protein [bacterium]|nr:addiction module protein [bacterium]